MNVQSTVNDFDVVRQPVVNAYESVKASAKTGETARLDALNEVQC
jgi:hypothetical protein